MSLSKKVVLTVSGYKISLSDSLQFYQNDQLKLIFEINKYGIDVASSFTHKTLMPLQPLTATLFIETPLGVDSIESANIEDNAVTFYLTSNQTQHIGTSSMQIKLTDDDGCQITLPSFTFEVQKNIYDNAVHVSGILLADENGNVLSDENGNTVNATATTETSKQIKDFTLKTGVSGQEDILIQDNGVTKRIKSSELIDTVDLSDYATKTDLNNEANVSQEKLREIESELNQTNAQLSRITGESAEQLEKIREIESELDQTNEQLSHITGGSVEQLEKMESELAQTNAQLSRITVESVEQLKNMEIVVNSIVKLHGYYVGDGVAHNRIIQQNDDGSGIQIANGLYANLLCGNGVDIKLFGGRANMGKDESIEVFDRWVNYVNSSKSKFFQPTTLDTGSSYIIYKPILIKKSFVGIGNPMPSFIYPSAEVGKVVSATEMSHNGIYDFNVKAVFGIKQINYGEITSRFKIENFAVYCTNGDDDTTPAQDYGVYFPEGNSFNMTNVLVVRPNVAGFKFYENWMSTIGTLNSWASRGDGFHFGDAVKGGNFTSLTIGSLYAHGYTGKGYRFQSLNYSTINSLGSDGARGGSGHAYVFASCHGTSVNSLGCESGNVKNILYIGDCTMTINGLFTLDMTLSESIIEVFSNSQITINNIHHHNGKIRRSDNTSPKSYIIRGDKSQVVINAKERVVTFEDGYKAGPTLSGTADVIFNTSDKDVYHKRYVNNRELHPGDDLTGSFIDLQNGWGFQMLKLDSSNFVSDFKYEKEWKHKVDVLYTIAQVQGSDGATVLRTENSATKAIVHLDKKLNSGVIIVMMFGRLAN